MQTVTKSTNRAHHLHCSTHSSDGKVFEKRHAHHRTRRALHVLLNRMRFDEDARLDVPVVLARPCTSWDIT
jgi:hypothetical protein